MISTRENTQPLMSTVYLIGIVMLLMPTLFYAYPKGWSDDLLLSPDTAGRRSHPDVEAGFQNNIWVVWDSMSWGTGYVYVSKRDSLGNCIIPETQVSASGYSLNCRLEIDNSDNVHVIWRELSPQGYGIGYAKLSDDGYVIVPAHLAAAGQGGASRPYFETTIDKDNNLHIACEEVISGYDAITYTLLDSLGNPIVSSIRVSAADSLAFSPGIAVDSFGNNHIAYRRVLPERLTYAKIDRHGAVLVPPNAIGIGYGPSILCDQHQNVHLFYTNPQGPGRHIYYVKLDNNGQVLIPPTRVSSPTDEDNSLCHSTIDLQQCMHITWRTARQQVAAYILYVKIDTSGDVLLPPADVVYPPHTFWAIFPRIATDYSNRLHLVWVDGRIDTVQRIFYKRGENESGVEEHAQLKTGHQLGISILPNPFSRETEIHFSFSQESEKVKVEIYDVLGRKVAQFDLGRSEGAITWRGTDNVGSYLPAGIYFLCCTIEGCITLAKITKLR